MNDKMFYVKNSLFRLFELYFIHIFLCGRNHFFLYFIIYVYTSKFSYITFLLHRNLLRSPLAWLFCWNCIAYKTYWRRKICLPTAHNPAVRSNILLMLWKRSNTFALLRFLWIPFCFYYLFCGQVFWPQYFILKFYWKSIIKLWIHLSDILICLREVRFFILHCFE